MEIPSWLAALLSLLTPVALAAWQMYQYFTGRWDKREDAREAAENRQLDMLTGQRDKIIADQRSEVERCQALLLVSNADRYHGWDTARRWYDLALLWRTLLQVEIGNHRETRQIAESVARRCTPPETVEWKTSVGELPNLPPFDTVKPP